LANTRVLVAQGEPLARHFIEEIVEREPDLTVIGTVGDGREVVARTLDLQPDLLLLDLGMPGIPGLEIVRRLAQREAPTRILALAAEDGDEVALRALRAGANGFLSNSKAIEYLPKAIRAVAAGESWIDRRTTSRLIEELQVLAGKAAASEGPDALLSPREKEVLTCLGRGLTNAQIARELFLSERTVKVHVSSIFRKLALPNRTQAALFARRNGLVRDDGLDAAEIHISPAL
jgi:DNA-binding NarL/FixJ family response regulator